MTNICMLDVCGKETKKGRKYCCKEHYYEWLRAGNAPRHWLGKKRPDVGKKISAKLKGRPNLALKGRKFPGRGGNFKKGMTPWNKGKKMSAEYCENVRRTTPVRYGPDNPSWNGGGYGRSGPRYAAWREEVFSRDGHACWACGEKSVNLAPHHMKRWDDYPEFRFDTDNALTLCYSCHTILHRRGYSDAGSLDDLLRLHTSILCPETKEVPDRH